VSIERLSEVTLRITDSGVSSGTGGKR